MPDKVPECLPDRMPEDLPNNMPEDMPDRMPDRMPEDMPDRMPDRMPEDMPDRMPEGMPDRMPNKMSDRMPEDLPVTKCINVMVGITRSKVIFPMFPLVSPFPFGPQTLQHQPPPLEGCMHKFHGKVLSFAKDQDPFSRISSITPFFKGCPFSRDALSQGPLATYPFARVLSFCKDQCWYLSLSQGMSKELQG